MPWRPRSNRSSTAIDSSDGGAVHPDQPAFSFFLDSDAVSVQPGDELWHRPLPLDRGAAPAAGGDAKGPSTGDYFRAVASFLTIDDHRHLLGALPDAGLATQRLPESVHIHLVKHGAFYHPAMVVIHAGGRRFSRVVNVAVSSQGRAVFAEEFAALRRLRDRAAGVIPTVYSAAQDIGPHQMNLFIADWLDGFSEWHLTGGGTDGVCRRVVVWDAVRGHHELSPLRTAQLFRKIAAILTGYYDVASSRHIGRWHHGAGDFIVRPEGRRMDVRLITVRRYAPLMAGVEEHPEDAIDALLVFLLELTLKNRLDRRDGIGDLVLSETAAVGWTVTGFFDGLADQVRAGQLPDDFFRGFLGVVSAFDPASVSQLVASLIDRLPADSEERALYYRHGDAHVAALTAEFKATSEAGGFKFYASPGSSG